ncbi:MAG: hypothetical protein U0791_02520 [Gemmataceae bacterium]
MRTTALLLCLFSASVAVAGDPASGLRPGEEVTAWEPIHVAGPHAGTKTCPVCTFLDAPVLLAFAKDMDEAGKLAKPLEGLAAGKLKVMLIVIEGSDEQLRSLAKDAGIRNLMLVRPDPERKEKQLKIYKIDATVSNTLMLYQDYIVRNCWTGLKATELALVQDAAKKYLTR